MPNVDGKAYPYTKKGMADAAKAKSAQKGKKRYKNVPSKKMN